MKYFWIGLLILFVLFGGCLTAALVTDHYAGAALDQLQQAISLAEQDRYPQAAALIEEASQTWADHKGFWGVVVRHAEADEVNSGFAATLQYAKKQDSEEFFGACAQLMEAIRHLSEMEVPHYYNVFTQLRPRPAGFVPAFSQLMEKSV